MVSWIIPIVRQSKTDLIHRQEMRPLRHGGSHFINQNLQNGCLHDVRDASLVCESSQFLTAWRLVLSMKPWSYIWLEFGLFSTIIAIIRACACWALFVVTLTNTVHLIYIYMYISMNRCVIVTNPYLHIIPLPGLSFYASALIGVLVSIEAVSRTWVEFLC